MFEFRISETLRLPETIAMSTIQPARGFLKGGWDSAASLFRGQRRAGAVRPAASPLRAIRWGHLLVKLGAIDRAGH
jgi:hypothetical protein